jgi:hypothetical protein
MGEIRIRVLPRESIGQGVLLLKKKKPHGAATQYKSKSFERKGESEGEGKLFQKFPLPLRLSHYFTRALNSA